MTTNKSVASGSFQGTLFNTFVIGKLSSSANFFFGRQLEDGGHVQGDRLADCPPLPFIGHTNERTAPVRDSILVFVFWGPLISIWQICRGHRTAQYDEPANSTLR